MARATSGNTRSRALKAPAREAADAIQDAFGRAGDSLTRSLARAAAEGSGAATPLGHHAEEIYAAFDAAGGGGEDFSAVIKYLRDR